MATSPGTRAAVMVVAPTVSPVISKKKTTPLTLGHVPDVGSCALPVPVLMCSLFCLPLSALFRFMVPDVGSWNYAFSGVKWSAGMKYGLRLSNPKPFFDEAHR